MIMTRNVTTGVGIVLLVSGVSFGQIETATDVTRAEYTAVRNAPEGGVDRQVKVVDIGKANVAVGIEDHVTYLSIRPDPDKVLPAGWVNPVIDP